MKLTTVLGSSIALIGATRASPLLAARQGSFKFECNGQQFPKLADCDALFQTFTDGTKTYTHPDGGNILSLYLSDQSDCQIDVSFWDQSYTVTENQIYNGINGVKTTCFPAGTGGAANEVGGRFSIAVRNNPNYDPPDNKKRTVARSAARTISVPMGEKGSIIEVVAKRADGDTSFSYGVHTTNAKPGDMKHNIGDGLPGGSTWEWSSEKSVTDHVSFSTSVSAGIEGIVSASVGTEISHDETFTSGQTTTITIKCDDNQYGQVYFQGYAEVWQGVLLPSGDQLTVTKPQVNSDGSTAGFYQYDCISK
ncbi:uncharacterized protein CC84DRAFT_1206720 [Paraphaeosphaeria sporulosa]|uniref:Uncharacterized protein n=1 Tax=Paraphaeosphaeria sporulosa TaxID=1460663 RepID=A0A177CD86_9PLEO|nr:uncharacterized protein CC84DRAFT_1206720 [Paraphaeosphaeria sporulosa]OAG05276.1 hypothetical protein CC84DRAFT_1206720 [Paraphaeosphaeria sporulosa]